jgi:hypothetical protein
MLQNEEISSMCDYSLHLVKSRAAKAGDRLVTTSFALTSTRGFAAFDEPTVAVCLRPGTELAFENDVRSSQPLSMFFRRGQTFGRLVRFRQVNTERTDTHHDAIEFANGELVLLTNLRPGQTATVIQLPVSQSVTGHNPLNAPVIDLASPVGRVDGPEWFFPL